MPDLSVAPYGKKGANMKRSFDVGAGPSVGIEDAIDELQGLVDDEELDEALVTRVAWIRDWEDILLVGEPRKEWKRSEAADTITAVCAPKELARIIEAMKKLRVHLREAQQTQWDALTKYLVGCAKNGGTICLWYDPMG